MATTPEPPIADSTITEGGVEAPYSDKPTPVMPYAARLRHLRHCSSRAWKRVRATAP